MHHTFYPAFVLAIAPFITAGLSIEKTAYADPSSQFGKTQPIKSVQLSTTELKLTANDGQEKDEFGAAVAIAGNVVFVGAPGVQSGEGAVYVFNWSDDMWVQTQKLELEQSLAGHRFGHTIALGEQVAIIGAPGIDMNVDSHAYVFTKNQDGWSLSAELPAGDGFDGDHYGWSVALSQDEQTAVVGARNAKKDNIQVGAVYVFTYKNGAWGAPQKLFVNQGELQAGAWVGYSVAINNDLILAGAPQFDTPEVNAGAAFLFNRTGDQWQPHAMHHKLIQGDQPSSLLGESVVFPTVGALVGTSNYKNENNLFGRFFVFDEQWNQTQNIFPELPKDYAKFAEVMAAEGKYVLVGAANPLNFNTDVFGAAFLYEWDGATWSEAIAIKPSEGGEGNASFGQAVDLSPPHLVVGGPLSPEAGAVWIYTLQGNQENGTTCISNVDCDSDLCVDGVCCDQSCGGGNKNDCQACSQAQGALVDGVCGPVIDGQACIGGICQMGQCIDDSPSTSTTNGESEGSSGDTDHTSGSSDGNASTSEGGSTDGDSETDETSEASTTSMQPTSGTETGPLEDDTSKGCGCHAAQTSGFPLFLWSSILLLLPGIRRRAGLRAMR